MNTDTQDIYNLGYEDSRLVSGRAQLEYERTKSLISRQVSGAKLLVLDVGGGPGRYASWLADQGHQVALIDPMERHVNEALSRSDQGRRFSAAVGDARHLDYDDASFDLVLCLGPLYHLVDQRERLIALTEAHRVLKSGGRILAAAISRYASVLDGMFRGMLFTDERFRKIVDQDLDTGVHKNPTDDPKYFTTAYFHLPSELRSELVETGFSDVEVLGVEGPGWLAPNFETRWNDSKAREVMISMAEKTESSESLLGLSAHIMATGAR